MRTLLALVGHFGSRPMSVLVCAVSNLALDQLIEKLVACEPKFKSILRLGR